MRPRPASRWRRFIPACAGNTPKGRGTYTPTSVHPRVCGEHYDDSEETPLDCGSSPRVRGTPIRPIYRVSQRRFIPACAGNTPWWVRRRPSTTVHPRVCGEHTLQGETVFAGNGSSPRVRGTLRRHLLLHRIRRFIPACAGNTRWCGLEGAGDAGSSPRVRGTLGRHVPDRAISRFIPACAGNTRAGAPWGRVRRRFIPACAGNTPRKVADLVAAVRFIPACAGNTLRRDGVAEAPAGSSPRVRGTRSRSSMRPPRRWFIPACAGNTRWPPKPRRPSTWFIPACAGNTAAARPIPAPTPVHPRVCGEHEQAQSPHRQPGGSSPRVRGTLRRYAGERSRQRFIPACAGNTRSSEPSSPSAPVHPRVCGEHPAPVRVMERTNGSSPRVRGTRAKNTVNSVH